MCTTPITSSSLLDNSKRVVVEGTGNVGNRPNPSNANKMECGEPLWKNVWEERGQLLPSNPQSYPQHLSTPQTRKKGAEQ